MSVDLCFEGKEGRKRGAAANSDIEKLSGVVGERGREGRGRECDVLTD